MSSPAYDAIIVGAGHNGLCAAIRLARAGWKVLVREAAPTVGGAVKSAELTLPGFTHDVGSTVASLVSSSPAMRAIPLEQLGVELVLPEVPLAHPLDGGTAAVLHRTVAETAAELGVDGRAWDNTFGPLVRGWEALVPMLLAPPRMPLHPVLLSRFGLSAIRSAEAFARRFKGESARALFGGVAAHSILPLDWTATAAFGLVLTLSAHAGGWPVVRGGMQKLADALATHLRALGGEIETAAPVASLKELPTARAIVCDVTPRQLVKLAGEQMPGGYRRKLERWRYGPGVFKMDWALSEPIPWTAPACRRAGTLHLGGTFGEIAAGEAACWRGEHTDRPYVLLVQPTVFDPTRAPQSKHTAWAYCHVPNGSGIDMTRQIENQIERFAPGFKDVVLARRATTPRELETGNANLVGGDITGGAQMFSQLFARPVARLTPYRTPIKGVYLCSSSTPPGGGVHGMAGDWAARTVLRDFA